MKMLYYVRSPINHSGTVLHSNYQQSLKAPHDGAWVGRIITLGGNGVAIMTNSEYGLSSVR
jgi:hypothetical protein